MKKTPNELESFSTPGLEGNSKPTRRHFVFYANMGQQIKNALDRKSGLLCSLQVFYFSSVQSTNTSRTLIDLVELTNQVFYVLC